MAAHSGKWTKYIADSPYERMGKSTWELMRTRGLRVQRCADPRKPLLE